MKRRNESGGGGQMRDDAGPLKRKNTQQSMNAFVWMLKKGGK